MLGDWISFHSGYWLETGKLTNDRFCLIVLGTAGKLQFRQSGGRATAGGWPKQVAADIDAAELAAWTMLINQVMNLDESSRSSAWLHSGNMRGEVMNPMEDYVKYETRRQFFSRGGSAVGWAVLATLMGRSDRLSAAEPENRLGAKSAASGPHFAGKAKRIIYLHMVGGPPQMGLV